MRAVWPGSSVRNAERTAVSAAAAAGDPDRYMRWAAHGLATAVLRHLTTGDTPPTVTAAGENHGRRLNAAGIGVAGARIVILVGPGGNGGDGLFAGAHLAARGAAVTAVPVASRVHQRGSLAFTAAGGRIHTLGSPVARRAVTGADVVIDAGFGTGARGGLPAELAEYWPHAAWVVAADAPSGLDTDTGEVLGDGFTPTADTTITFGALKTGLFLGQGRARAGAVTEVAIPGLLDPEVLGRLDFTILDEHDAFDSVLSATPNDHKYSRGVLGLLAGSPAYPGAAILAAHAALATGVGMLTSFSRSTAATQLAAAVPEAVVLDRSAQPDAASSSPQAAKVSAWLLGPGLGDASEDLDAATALLTGPGAAETPQVVDASALAVVPPSSAGTRAWILTPHAGELRALSSRLGLDQIDPVRDPLGAVTSAAAALRCVVLLKGPTTLIATPDGTTFAACSGGPELAVAGAGDTLAGILGALVATHASRLRGTDSILSQRDLARLAASAAVLHGLAGRRAMRHGDRGARPLASALASILAGGPR